jgi:hypothetical protein
MNKILLSLLKSTFPQAMRREKQIEQKKQNKRDSEKAGC